MLSTLPAELGLDVGKAAKLVADLAKERKRTTLVQVGGRLVGALPWSCFWCLCCCCRLVGCWCGCVAAAAAQQSCARTPALRNAAADPRTFVLSSCPHSLPPQAISFLRQKNMGDATKSLNNLVSCEAAVPSDSPVAWGEAEELADLFSAYCSKVGGCWVLAGGWVGAGGCWQPAAWVAVGLGWAADASACAPMPHMPPGSRAYPTDALPPCSPTTHRRLQESAPEKQAVVQKILGLSEAEAASLRSIVQSGGFKMGQQAEEEEAAFF